MIVRTTNEIQLLAQANCFSSPNILWTSVRDLQDLIKAAEDALDSLEYVEQNLPGQSGYGVRQSRIGKLKAVLKDFKKEIKDGQ